MKLKEQIRNAQIAAMMQATDECADEVERQMMAAHGEIQRLQKENAELKEATQRAGSDKGGEDKPVA